MTRLTSIVYTNEAWADADGGALQLYDESTEPPCWRAVRPKAGRLVVFYAPSMLHKVAPAYRERFALTAWWMASPSGARRGPGEMVTVHTRYEPGDPRRLVPFTRDADGRTEAGLLGRMQRIGEHRPPRR